LVNEVTLLGIDIEAILVDSFLSTVGTLSLGGLSSGDISVVDNLNSLEHFLLLNIRKKILVFYLKL
jgi:hypothetical protein